MMDRRTGAAIGIGVLGITLVVLFLLTPMTSAPPASFQPSRGPSGPVTAAPSRNPTAPLEGAVTVVDGLFDDRAERTVKSPTRHKNQSKLFFADGSWWGVLHEPTTREARLMRLDWDTQRWSDTGTVIDDRTYARADVLFLDDVLYVASAGGSDSPAHAAEISRYRLDPTTDRWSRDPDFPVTVTPRGVESILIDRATDGTLWVAYIDAGNLFVAHTLGDDHRWSRPYRPPVTGGDVATDQVGMVAVAGEVVLLWSNQNDEAIYSTRHIDGEPDDAWAEAITVVSGLAVADNHVNIKALPDGRLFAVAKTSLDTVPANQPGWDQVLVLSGTSTDWSSQQFGQIRDKHTRPIVVLDTEHEEVLVFATSPAGGGAIYMKHGAFDDPRFPVGRGVPVLATTEDAGINDGTSTKQPVDATTGVVVLAADDDNGHYVHMAASLGGPLPGRPSAASPPPGPEPPPDVPVVLVDEPFDAFTVDDKVQPTWRMAPTRADGRLAHVARADGDIAVRARTSGPGELRPCRAFPATGAGTVELVADVRLDRQGAGDTVLFMVRGDGEELGSLRVDDLRRIRVSALGSRETTSLTMDPGAWYRVRFLVDAARKTLDVELRDPGGDTILERSRLPWRSPESTVVDGLCFAPSQGRSGLGLSFDRVRVTRIP
jgi:hypothetical protein